MTLFKKSRGIAIQEIHAVASIGESSEGLAWTGFVGKECKERKLQSQEGKFIGLRMGKDSWQAFISQELSLGLLYIRHLMEISLSLLTFHSSESSCMNKMQFHYRLKSFHTFVWVIFCGTLY